MRFLLVSLKRGKIVDFKKAVINDVVDKEKDKQHPIKRKRPIASGELRVSNAIVFSMILIVVSLLTGFYLLNILFWITAVTYFVLNLLYSVKLKHFIIVDVLLISIFFVLRAAAGAVVIDVPISPWLVICTFLLALLKANEITIKKLPSYYLVNDNEFNENLVLNTLEEVLDRVKWLFGGGS